MSLRLLLAIGVSVCLSTGCTLLGAGVGGAVDAAAPGPYELRAPATHVSIKPEDRIKVWLVTGQSIQGRYLGSLGPTPRDRESYLVIDAETRARLVAVSDIKALGVEVSGKGWVYGGLIGLVVDVTLVVVAVIAYESIDYGNLDLGGAGCFC